MDKLPDWPEKPMYDEPDEAFINYERAMKEAYAVRLKHLIDACGDEGGHKPDKDQTCFICKALAEIGELP